MGKNWPDYFEGQQKHNIIKNQLKPILLKQSGELLPAKQIKRSMETKISTEFIFDELGEVWLSLEWGFLTPIEVTVLFDTV